MKTATPKQWFDACAMIGGWHRTPPQFSTAAQLLGHMERFRIARALVFHSIAWMYDFRQGNAVLDDEIAAHPQLVPCYAVVPSATGETPELEHWDGLLRGGRRFAFRLFPRSHEFMPCSPGANRFHEFAAHRRIPVLVDIDEISWDDLWTLCRTHPLLRVIIGNSGTNALYGLFRQLRRLYEFLELFPQVRIETSLLCGFRNLEAICERFGAGRLIFGSRMPFWEPGSSIMRLQYADLDPREKQLIAHDNLAALLDEVGP